VPFVLLMTTFWGISWLWSYSILYWVSDKKDRMVSLRFIKLGAIISVLSHLGWIFLHANWWGVLLLDVIFLTVSTGVTLVVSGKVRQKFAKLKSSNS